MEKDIYFMRKALEQAGKAYKINEVPVGAVIVKNGKIIARGYNKKETRKDSTEHAEINAIKKACKKLNTWRLIGCTMYVTLEPCSMCAGAIIQSRIDRLCIGTMDEKTGSCGSVLNLLEDYKFNHHVELENKICEKECREILKKFFRELRQTKNMERCRSGHNGTDSKFLEAPAVSSAENVRRTGLCAGSDFTISYRSCVFFLHSSGAGITLEVYGELSERSKVRHSKCRVPKRNLGFESLTLRQKPSHIKAFAHMTGLFFSLKVTSAYMIFGKSSGVPAGLPCVRQGQDIVHHICRGDLGLVIQMAVNIRRRANIAVTQPLLDLLQRHIVRQKQ